MGWYQWCLRQSHQLHLSPMTATLGTPTGRVDGLYPRRRGAARTRKWAAWSPNPMTATQVTPIGRVDGPFPRRHGAARTRKWAVWSPNPMIAMLGIQIGRLAGLFPRRHGAARTRKRVAQERHPWGMWHQLYLLFSRWR